jgi:hypothetical protein
MTDLTPIREKFDLEIFKNYLLQNIPGINKLFE